MSTPQEAPLLADAGPFRGGRSGKLRKVDALHHALQRQILLGELAAQTVLTEQQIAGHYGCSQGTVREALMRLEQDGLVSRRGYRGTVVSTTPTAEAVHMVNIRLEVETAGVQRVAGRLPVTSRTALTGIIDEMAAASARGDAYACSELDRAFHTTLFRASGLHTMEPILRRCALHMHRFTVHERSEFFTDSNIAEVHRGLLAVVETGDDASAAAAIRSHVHAVIAQWSPDLLLAMRAAAATR